MVILSNVNNPGFKYYLTIKDIFKKFENEMKN